MKNSVLLIGIDGAGWNLLEPWLSEGKLQNLKKLCDAGAKADLKTTIPPLSCSAWASLFTGRNPGKHGIYEYLTDSGKLVNSSSIKNTKIWQILNKKRCCIVNVPMTFPVDKINGYMIAGFLTPPDEEIYTYPSSLMSLLKRNNYKVRYEFLPDKEDVSDKKYKFLDELYDALEKRYQIAKQLMNEPWDFFMLVFDETGMLQYLFWDRKDIMLEFFKKLDFYIGELLKDYSIKNPNPFIFIVSDHGFSEAPKRQLNFRVWLNEIGVLKDKRSLFQRIVPKVYKKIRKMPISETIFKFAKTKEIRESFQRRITSSASIYYRYPGLFIDKNNIKNREYEELRNKLISKLKQLQDNVTNENIFLIVEKRENVYSGNYTDLAPDIIAIPKHSHAAVFSYDSDKLFEDIKLYHPGRHFSDLYGMFLVYGDKVANKIIKSASILDVCPTILHIFGLSVPEDVDGKVLKEIFKKGSDLFSKKVTFSKEENINLDEKNKIWGALKSIKI